MEKLILVLVLLLAGCVSMERREELARKEIIEAHLAWRSASAYRAIQTLSSNYESFVFGKEYDRMVFLAKHSDVALEHLYGQYNEAVLSGDFRDRDLGFALVDALGWGRSGFPLDDYKKMNFMLVGALDLRRRSLASYRGHRPAFGRTESRQQANPTGQP